MTKYTVEVMIQQTYTVEAEDEDAASETNYVLKHGELVFEEITDTMCIGETAEEITP